MKKVKLTTATLALLAGTAMAPIITNAVTVDPSEQAAKKDWNTESAKEGKASEAAGQDAWEQVAKEDAAKKDWNTESAKAGKAEEDAHGDAWEEMANLENAKNQAFKELQDKVNNGEIDYLDGLGLTDKITGAKTIKALQDLGFLAEKNNDKPVSEDWDTPTAEEGKSAEDAHKDAWEEATKPSTPSEDWNTPTAEEGKTTEDAHKDAWENEANDALKDSSKKDDEVKDSSKKDDGVKDSSKKDGEVKDSSKKDDGVKDSSKKVATKTIEKNEVKNNEKTLPQTNEKMNMGLVIGGISSALASAFMFFRRK